MARLKRCDLCGAEADELMSIDFPYEERWMLFFHKRSLAHYADLCLDCLEKIRAERQAQIKANEVDFEIADTPQTDCDDRYAVRTDSGEVVAYACPLGCEQTDCGWK